MSLAFTALHRNVMFAKGTVAALYKLDCRSYEFLSAQEKEALHGQLAWFAYSVESDFSLWRVSRAYPASNYVADTVGMVDDRVADPNAWEMYLQSHEAHLTRMRSFVTEVYLAVALKPSRRPLIENIRQAAQRVSFTLTDLSALMDAEQATLDNLTEHLSARRATTLEVQWLLRRAATRGVGEPELDANWQPPALTIDAPGSKAAYEPRGRTLVRHAAAITEEERTLIVDSDDHRSYQAMLGLGALPQTSQFPGGSELLFTPLEALDFPVDAVAHVRWIDNDTMQNLVGKRVKDADNAFEEQAHNPQSWAPEQNRVAARDVQEYFSTEPYPPGLDTAISFAVGAQSRDELKARVARLRKRFGAVKLHRPFGLQAALYEDHLPRPDGGTVGDYSDILTVEQFGALMPVASHFAGANRGVYFGRTVPGAPRPIKVDVTEASKRGRPPSILLAGTLGSGKTIAAELLAFQAAMRGSLVVDVDPRPDHNLEGLPDLAGKVHVIELSSDERYRGMLDPLAVAPAALREDLANSYLTRLLPQPVPPAWETQVRKAVRKALLLANPSCMGVIDLLLGADHEEARQAGEALEVWADSGVGRLAFGDGSQAPVEAQALVTSIKAHGLSLPPAGGIVTSSAERLGLATLSLVAAYAMRLVSGDRSRHKVVLIDEAWFLLSSSDGRNLIDRISRMGRSMNTTLVLASQQLTDVGDLEALIGTRLIFGQETDAEARRALELLGLDPDDRSLVERVRGYRRGRCLMKDVDGRICEMQVDPVSSDFLEILNTAPDARHVLERA
jgi:hypothetical protein